MKFTIAQFGANQRQMVLPVLALASALFAACARLPDFYPSGTPVTLTVSYCFNDPIQLGPRSSKLFLDMLSTRPTHSQISQMMALPTGKFKVAGVEYLWHGNGVIRGKGRSERLWHGPYLQRLIAAVMREDRHTRESIQRILDTLEYEPSVASTPLDGPGAYPDGRDALHPVQADQTNGWRVFNPATNGP